MRAAVLLVLAMSAAAIRLQQPSVTKRLNIMISRHGLSCANVMESKRMPDSMLTECGVVRSKAVGAKLKDLGLQPDTVFTSHLMRTAETAHYQYPGVPTIALPLILSTDVDQSYDSAKQTALLAVRHGDEGISRDMSYSYLNTSVHENQERKERWWSFIEFLAKDFLPKFKPLLEKDTSSIAVITHDNYVAHIPEARDLCAKHVHDLHRSKYAAVLDEFRNNDLVILEFDYNLEAKELKVDAEAGCRFERVFAKWPTGFCEDDFGPICQQEVTVSHEKTKKFPKHHERGCCAVA